MTISVGFEPLIVDQIRWRVPRGASGMVGWQLSSSGAQVIPSNAGGFMIVDGESGVWQVDGLHNSGDWNVTAYNLGIYSHGIYLEFFVRPISQPPAQADRIAAVTSLAMANLIGAPGQ